MTHEENGQIIVDELRPMSEVKPGWLVKPKKADYFEHCVSLGSHDSIMTSSTGIYYVRSEGFEGCLPMPIYRPKDGK